MPRHRANLSWLEPASSGGLSPMQLLIVWLSRHYSTYTNSNTKVEMLEELCQGMRDAGYPSCTVHAIRSKIGMLRREAQQERTGDHHHSRAFHQYQQSLMAIFGSEDASLLQEEDTSDTETSGEDGSREQQLSVKLETTSEDESPLSPIAIAEGDANEEARADLRAGARRSRMVVENHLLDVTEIRRRFDLLCARQVLEQRGIAMEIIDRVLPLPEE